MSGVPTSGFPMMGGMGGTPMGGGPRMGGMGGTPMGGSGMPGMFNFAVPSEQPFPAGGAANYQVGDPVEIWSNSFSKWCPGEVEHIVGGMVTASFHAPNGENMTKQIPADNEQIRPMAGGPPSAGASAVGMPSGAFAGGAAYYQVGDPVEVWSNSLSKWCPGEVEHIAGGMVTARFYTPSGNDMTKQIPADNNQIRPMAGGPPMDPSPCGASGTQRIPTPARASETRRQRGVVVDDEEDIVVPGQGGRTKAHLATGAMHGQLDGALTSEHGHETTQDHQFEANPHASSLANSIVHQAFRMGRRVAAEQRDVVDNQWEGPERQDALAFLYKTGDPMAVGQNCERLAMEVQQILESQPMVVEASVPVKVFGDIHGQFRDMLLFFQHFGFPDWKHGPTYIFNGDWADRGRHQLEVVSLVFALKAWAPNKVFLIRGNHEDAVQNQAMGQHGFDYHCQCRLGQQLGPRVFGAIQQTFNWLPLACLISRKILCVHGGIGDGQWDIDQIRRVDRPLDHDGIPRDKAIYNILWSDPIADDPGDPRQTFGVHDSPRDGHANMIVTFGKDITDAFCARNGIDMIVRSHQTLTRGYGYDVMHGGQLVRVFSARDYENQGNDGCILSITEGDPNHGKGPHLLVRAQVVRSSVCPKADG